LLHPTCQAGTCLGPPGLWSKKLPLDQANDDGLLAAAPGPDGEVLAVGRLRLPREAGGSQEEVTLFRLSAAGEVLAQRTVPGLQHNDEMPAVAALKNGQFLAVGWLADLPSVVEPEPQPMVRWLRFDRDLYGTPNPPKVNQPGHLLAVAVAQDGSPLAVGRSVDQAIAVRFHKTEDQIDAPWLQLPAGYDSGELSAVAADPSTAVGWVAAGHVTKNDKWQVWLQRFGADLATPPPGVLWAPATGHVLARHVVVRPDGTVLVVGQFNAKGYPSTGTEDHMFLASFTAELQPLWHRISASPDAGLAIAWLEPQALLVVVGKDATPGTGRNLLAWYGGDGTPLLRREDNIPSTGAVLAVAGDRLFFAGAVKLGDQVDSLVLRTDLWGNPSCAASGTCAVSLPGACSETGYCSGGTCKD